MSAFTDIKPRLNTWKPIVDQLILLDPTPLFPLSRQLPPTALLAVRPLATYDNPPSLLELYLLLVEALLPRMLGHPGRLRSNPRDYRLPQYTTDVSISEKLRTAVNGLLSFPTRLYWQISSHSIVGPCTRESSLLPLSNGI